jgi:hypothetical protein
MLNNINYPLLARQKLALLELQKLCRNSSNPKLAFLADESEGIVYLIDSVQDSAVDRLKLNPSQVFPKLESPIYWARKCDSCGKGMNKGYLVNDVLYYCTDRCLHKHVTKAEWEDLHQRYPDENYYTEWEDENDVQYVEFDSEVKEIDL